MHRKHFRQFPGADTCSPHCDGHEHTPRETHVGVPVRIVPTAGVSLIEHAIWCRSCTDRCCGRFQGTLLNTSLLGGGFEEIAAISDARAVVLDLSISTALRTRLVRSPTRSPSEDAWYHNDALPVHIRILHRRFVTRPSDVAPATCSGIPTRLRRRRNTTAARYTSLHQPGRDRTEVQALPRSHGRKAGSPEVLKPKERFAASGGRP